MGVLHGERTKQPVSTGVDRTIVAYHTYSQHHIAHQLAATAMPALHAFHSYKNDNPHPFIVNSELQQSPGIIIHRRENHTMTQQLLPRLHHIRDIHPAQGGNILHMQTLIVLRTVLQRLIHPPRHLADVRHAAAVDFSCSAAAVVVHAVGGAGPAAAAGLGFYPIERPAREVEVHVCRFEEVVCDVHLVRDGPDDVRADVSLVVEGLQPAPDAGPFVFCELGLGGGGPAAAAAADAVDVH